MVALEHREFTDWDADQRILLEHVEALPGFAERFWTDEILAEGRAHGSARTDANQSLRRNDGRFTDGTHEITSWPDSLVDPETAEDMVNYLYITTKMKLSQAMRSMDISDEELTNGLTPATGPSDCESVLLGCTAAIISEGARRIGIPHRISSRSTRMKPATDLKRNGARVLDFSRSVPNLGRLGELTEATVGMLQSKDWRDYSDAIGTYHWLPGEFDYFLALQTVDARDIARLYLTPDQRAELAGAMDRTRTGEARYRRTLDEVCTANPAAAQSLTVYSRPGMDGIPDARPAWGARRHPCQNGPDV